MYVHTFICIQIAHMYAQTHTHAAIYLATPSVVVDSKHTFSLTHTHSLSYTQTQGYGREFGRDLHSMKKIETKQKQSSGRWKIMVYVMNQQGTVTM